MAMPAASLENANFLPPFDRSTLTGDPVASHMSLLQACKYAWAYGERRVLSAAGTTALSVAGHVGCL
jgi:hypothetical protein